MVNRVSRTAVPEIRPEIRIRLDPAEKSAVDAVMDRIGMTAQEAVRVFLRRTVAANGLPFPMAEASADSVIVHLRPGDLPTAHGVSVQQLARLGRDASDEARAAHRAAGREIVGAERGSGASSTA